MPTRSVDARGSASVRVRGHHCAASGGRGHHPTRAPPQPASFARVTDPMTSDDFRRHGRALIDWLADYWDGLESRRIMPEVAPGQIRAMLPERAPETGEPFERILADLDRIVMPGLTHWQSPGWFAYFPSNVSFPSILGELASAGLGQQGMLWQTSPATTELEATVLDWLVDLMGLPPTWKVAQGPGGGVLQMSASDSTHTALVVARTRAAGSASPSRQVAYASRQAHSSVEKGARVAGYGHVRLVDTDDALAMDPAALDTAMAEDRAAGLHPSFVCATVGTTGTTAVDPLAAIAPVTRRHGAWLHVDAAYAGSGMICEELRHHQAGVEAVDSYTFNPHKWLLTNFDCSVFWVADRAPLIDTMSIVPPYLRNAATDSGEVVDYRDWHVPLGRRFRALKLWFVLRHYGAEGLRRHVRLHVEQATALAARIDAHPRLRTIAPTPFGLVSFVHTAGNDDTARLARAINDTGTSYVTTSVLDALAFVRVSIGSTLTTARHVDALWSVIEREA